jgi:hypothetical protein
LPYNLDFDTLRVAKFNDDALYSPTWSQKAVISSAPAKTVDESKDAAQRDLPLRIPFTLRLVTTACTQPS